MEQVKNKKDVKKHSVFFRFLAFALIILIAVFFIRSRIELSKMEVQLAATRAQIARQELLNKEVTLLLSDDSEYMEHEARDGLDYASPEERVFIVVP